MAILQMLLKQSRLASQAKAGSRVSAVQVTLPVQATLPNAPARWVKPESMIKRYGQANVDAIHQWWSVCGSEALEGRSDLKLVSGIQLFLTLHGPRATRGRMSIERDGMKVKSKSQLEEF